MALRFELAAFTVRTEDEAALVAERGEMIHALQRAFPAALAAWLTRQDDGSWLDVILWRSRQEDSPGQGSLSSPAPLSR
jgi:hypothetical protein